MTYGVPRKSRSAGTAVSAGILALTTALVYGGYGLLATIVMVDRGVAEAAYFAVVAGGGLLALVGAILVFLEKDGARAFLLTASLVLVVGSVLLAVVPIPRYLTASGRDDPRMLIHLVGILPALVIALLALLPATRRYLAGREAPEQPTGPVWTSGPAAADPAGKAMAIGGSVCGFLLGLVMISIGLDVGFEALFGFDTLPGLLGVILAVVGAFVAFGRTWSGGLLLAIGGGVALAYILIALFRSGADGLDFRSVVFLLSAIGALVLPLLPPARKYLRTG